jgi:hypothetical protein
VVDALLLRPLPYPQPDRLANIWLRSPGIGILRDWPSPGQYIDLKNENHLFEEMAIARLGSMTITGLEQPERVDGMRTSSSLFHMLGANAGDDAIQVPTRLMTLLRTPLGIRNAVVKRFHSLE